jgi:hypothetical protein
MCVILNELHRMEIEAHQAIRGNSDVDIVNAQIALTCKKQANQHFKLCGRCQEESREYQSAVFGKAARQL